MELKIYNPSEDSYLKAIEWNFDELKAELTEKAEEYKTIVYTSDDQIKKEAKADRAKLRKLIDAMETERKRIKNQCMEPVSVFEKQIKELTVIVDAAVKNIDAQVKAYEERRRNEKLEKIREIYAETIPESMRSFVPFEVALMDKYLLSGTSLKAVREGMQVLAERVKSDMETISKLPEYVFEVTERYKMTLDLQMALRVANDLRDAAERKRIFEEQRQRRDLAYRQKQEKEAEALKSGNRGFVPAQPETPAQRIAMQPVRESEIREEPSERVVTLKFKVTARQSQFDEVNRILAELKRSCTKFEIINEMERHGDGSTKQFTLKEANDKK